MTLQTKPQLLAELRENVRTAIGRGDLPRPRQAKLPTGTQGPRAGVLRIDAGMDTGDLHAALRANSKAKARQVFPESWLNCSEPSVYMSGRECCLEAAWPEWLQTRRVNLSEIGQYPQTPDACVLGKNDSNQTVTLKFDQQVTQNLLLAGMSGSGKTTTATSIVAQLARNAPDARFVVCDGKGDLSALAELRGLAGPYASNAGEIVAALHWVKATMDQRNRHKTDKTALYLLWDEPQELLLYDSTQAATFFNIVSKCRSANIHVILSTQSPKQELFGVSMTRGQFGAAVCHLVRDRHESEAALGDTEPRADHLTGTGDAYVVAPGVCERVLIAYPDAALVDSVMGTGAPELDAWPLDYDDLPTKPCLSPEQAAAALWAAQGAMSRSNLREAMDAAGGAFTNSDYAAFKAFGAAAAAAYAVLARPSEEKDV